MLQFGLVRVHNMYIDTYIQLLGLCSVYLYLKSLYIYCVEPTRGAEIWGGGEAGSGSAPESTSVCRVS